MTNAVTLRATDPARAPRPQYLHYDLVDLRVFLAIADAGNVSRGAQRCHLAPSSASLRISGLESALGVQLFERQARGVALTQAGQVLVEHARRCLALLEQMHADLAPYASGVRGHVTLFANNNALAAFLPDDMEAYFARHPSVRITLEERTSADIVAAVAAGRADVGIVAWDEDHPELSFVPYRDDELVMLVAAGDPLAQHASVRLADCLQRPFVCLQSGSAIHTFLVERAAALGQRLDIRVQVSGYPAIGKLVASGAGVAMVPASVAPVSDARLRALPLAETWATRRLRICTRRGAEPLNPNARALVEHLGRRD